MSRLKSNIISQYVLQLAKYLVPFATLPFLARVLGPDEYAVRAYTVSFMVFFQTFADFGFTRSGTKAVVETRDDQSRVSSVYSSIIQAKFLIIGALLLVLLGIIWLVPMFEGNYPFVLVSFAGVALNAFLPDYIFQGFEKMSLITKRYMISKCVSMVLIFCFVREPDQLLLVAVFEAGGNGIALIWALLNVKTEFGVSYIRASFNASVNALTKSARYFTISFFSSILNSFSVVMVGFSHASSVELSVWSLALSLLNAAQSMYTPLVNSLYPHMLVNQDFKLMKKVALWSFPLVVLASAVVVCLSNTAVCLILGSEYEQGSYLLAIAVSVLPFSFCASLLGWPVLGAVGCVKELSYGVYVAGAATVLVLLAALVTDQLTIMVVAFARVAVELLQTCVIVACCINNRSKFRQRTKLKP